MKKLIVPIVMLLIGSGSGVGAALFLFPPKVASEAEAAPTTGATQETQPAPSDVHTNDEAHDNAGNLDNEFAKLANQFVVPLVQDGRVTGLVVMSLSLEVPPGGVEAAFSVEPRLRDAFLQVMFDHANVGGFSGNFTDASNMRVLRDELRRSAKFAVGDIVTDILIQDIVRQDI